MFNKNTFHPTKKENLELSDLLEKIMQIGYKYHKSVDEISFFQQWDHDEVSRSIFHDLPDEGFSHNKMLKFLNERLIPYFPSNSNRNFMGFVPSDPTSESVIFGALTPFFNQFTGSAYGSPGGTAIESLVINWIKSLLNLPEMSFGSFTSGGSMANLTCIYSGLVHQLSEYGINFRENGLFGSKRPLIYISDQTHNSVIKSIIMLGLGKNSVRIVESNENFKMTAESVKRQIMSDMQEENALPLMIISTSGTTNTGSIDELEGLSKVASEYNLWHHIDGAYGAFAKISNHEVSLQLKGIETCDSIALDCHKWFYSPYEAGIALVRNHKILFQSFNEGAEYLKDTTLNDDVELQRNFYSYGFPLSRELRGLKIWATIVSLGLNKIKNYITTDILKADHLRTLLEKDERFEIRGNTSLSTVCFVYKDSQEITAKIVSELQEGQKYYVSRTELRGEKVIRVCIINRRSNIQMVDDFYNEVTSILGRIV